MKIQDLNSELDKTRETAKVAESTQEQLDGLLKRLDHQEKYIQRVDQRRRFEDLPKENIKRSSFASSTRHLWDQISKGQVIDMQQNECRTGQSSPELRITARPENDADFYMKTISKLSKSTFPDMQHKRQKTFSGMETKASLKTITS